MDGINRRSETRKIIDAFYSIQFLVKGLPTLYQFPLWDISPHGLCIVVDNVSDILPVLSVGDILRVKYYPQDLYGSTRISKTEIRHITQSTEHRFNGHYLVGLRLLD